MMLNISFYLLICNLYILSGEMFYSYLLFIYMCVYYIHIYTHYICVYILLLNLRGLEVFILDTSLLSGEGNGTPLQYSCLENPMDGGARYAAVHGVARVGRDWATSLSLFTFMHWRRKWQPTPVFLPGESQGLEAWWAAVYGVAQSQTRLKRFSSSSNSSSSLLSSIWFVNIFLLSVACLFILFPGSFESKIFKF